MRKILFILLLLFITLITSCDSINDECIHKWIRNDLTYVCELCGEKQVLTDEIQKNKLSKEEWNILLNKDNYKNYTLEYSMYGDDPSFTYVLSYNKFNISETNVSFTNKENGELIVDNILFPIEESAIYRYLYETLFTKFLEKYEDFEIYERENQMYKAVKDIIVEINIEESGMKLICTFKDAI